MADLLKSKRIKFPVGKQKLFIEKCKSKLGYTLDETARCLNVNIRTVTDWKREKFLMPVSAVRKLSRKAKATKAVAQYLAHTGYIALEITLPHYGKRGNGQEEFLNVMPNRIFLGAKCRCRQK